MGFRFLVSFIFVTQYHQVAMVLAAYTPRYPTLIFQVLMGKGGGGGESEGFFWV